MGRRIVSVAFVALLVGLNLVAVLSTSQAGGATPCSTEEATKVGTSGHDVLRGTKRRDVIKGRGGNDTIYGLGRADTLCGGPGNDSLYGGKGNDHLEGHTGNDNLYGGPGDDFLHSHDEIEGNDYLDGQGDGAHCIRDPHDLMFRCTEVV